MPFEFVDCHSHVVPSGDDGARSLAAGRALCLSALAHGTRILFATPHVWPHLTLTEERERGINEAFEQLRSSAGLELRLGFELTPARPLLEDDPARYALEGTGAVLMEAPFQGPLDLLIALAEHVEAAGLRPVIAHPERVEAVVEQPGLATGLAERGWLLQINATSLTGWHGPLYERLAWQLVEEGSAGLVASDGHRTERPAHLDAAYAVVQARLPEARARALFDGSALGVAPASTAVSTAA